MYSRQSESCLHFWNCDFAFSFMTCRWIKFAALCLLACGLAVVVPSCTRRTADHRASPPASDGRDAPRASALGSVMLSLPVSAYHVSIAAADDDVFYLMTATAAYRLEPDRATAAMPLDLGAGAAATRSSIVFWSQGAVWSAPKTGGAPRRLLAVPERPQLFVASASGEDFAWLARGRDGRFAVHALAGKGARAAYTSAGSIDAAMLLSDAVVFVEGLAGGQWRMGRVGISGGPATFTALRKGRAPAMLTGRSAITYYAGSGYEVRRLSPDLQREETLSRNFVCTPLAVAEPVVICASVEGLFALQPGAPPRRLVAGSAERLITDVAASPRRVVWTVDAGPDSVEVRSLSLP